MFHTKFSWSHHSSRFSCESIWAVWESSAVWLCLSRAQHLRVREANIMIWGAVNLNNTCSLDSGAWCEVSSARYPIDHIYCIHHSTSLFWQLIAPGKESERIGLLFETGNAFSVSSVFAFFCALGLQREISHWCWRLGPTETTTTAEWYSKYSSGKFLAEITLRKNIYLLFSQLYGTFAVVVCLECWKNNLCPSY